MKSRLFDKQYSAVEGNINNVAQEDGQILLESVCTICVHLYVRAKKGQGKTGYESLLVLHWLFVRRRDKRVRRQFIALCVNTLFYFHRYLYKKCNVAYTVLLKFMSGRNEIKTIVTIGV